jgi:hypothetical protein
MYTNRITFLIYYNKNPRKISKKNAHTSFHFALASQQKKPFHPQAPAQSSFDSASNRCTVNKDQTQVFFGL